MTDILEVVNCFDLIFTFEKKQNGELTVAFKDGGTE